MTECTQRTAECLEWNTRRLNTEPNDHFSQAIIKAAEIIDTEADETGHSISRRCSVAVCQATVVTNYTVQPDESIAVTVERFERTYV